MGLSGWLTQNWFDLFSAIGIIGGLCFTGFTLQEEAKTRRITNLVALTASQRETLKVFYENVKLTRILDASADINNLPVNRAEEIYTGVLIQHLFAAYCAMQYDLSVKPEGLRQDVREFFALPIPKFVWSKRKKFQDSDFVQFIESCRNEK